MDEKYMQLVKTFPLLPVTNKAQHQAAKAIIAELALRDAQLSSSEIGYGKVLVQIVQNYERETLQGFFEDVSGNEALQYLLDEHGLKQTEVAEIAGVSKQNIHDFLKGRRSLPREARIRLARHFRLQAGVFELVRQLTSA
jgi:HTH-type transcriptional regulator/antitoxin HigA